MIRFPVIYVIDTNSNSRTNVDIETTHFLTGVCFLCNYYVAYAETFHKDVLLPL